MIGIIGYGMVGKAVDFGFSKCSKIFSDPQYNSVSIADVCSANPEVIFVCVPTPTDNTDYSLLKGVLQDIKSSNYRGVVAVKSTILPRHLEGFDVVFNPEFLSRATALQDFVKPCMLVFGGDREKTKRLEEIYKKYSNVETQHVFHTDIKTACLLKYSFNTYYAMKVTYMNALYDIAKEMGVDYNNLISMMKENSWVGSHHFQVPGPDGLRGFGGPCLPKDTEALAKEFNVDILHKILELNKKYRYENSTSSTQ